jgi:hypothetical protein
MKQQETFEFVARHLFAQGHKAVGGQREKCMYRGNDGSMCAVGCLIPDDDYSRGMETLTAAALIKQFGDRLPSFLKRQVRLLGDLQSVHDNGPTPFTTEYLREALRLVGSSHSLKTKFLDSLEVAQ